MKKQLAKANCSALGYEGNKKLYFTVLTECLVLFREVDIHNFKINDNIYVIHGIFKVYKSERRYRWYGKKEYQGG